MGLFSSLLTYHKYEWIGRPHLICEQILTEANISIDLKCYDDNYIESRAKLRTEWIAEYHKKKQKGEE